WETESSADNNRTHRARLICFMVQFPMPITRSSTVMLFGKLLLGLSRWPSERAPAPTDAPTKTTPRGVPSVSFMSGPLHPLEPVANAANEFENAIVATVVIVAAKQRRVINRAR